MARRNFDEDLHIARVAEPGELVLRDIGAGATGVGAVVVAVVLTVAVAAGAMSVARGGGGANDRFCSAAESEEGR